MTKTKTTVLQSRRQMKQALKQAAKQGGYLGGAWQRKNTAWQKYCTNGMLDYKKLPSEKPNGFRYPLELAAWKMKCLIEGKTTDALGNIIPQGNRMTASIKDAVKKPVVKHTMKELVDAK